MQSVFQLFNAVLDTLITEHTSFRREVFKPTANASSQHQIGQN